MAPPPSAGSGERPTSDLVQRTRVRVTVFGIPWEMDARALAGSAYSILAIGWPRYAQMAQHHFAAGVDVAPPQPPFLGHHAELVAHLAAWRVLTGDIQGACELARESPREHRAHPLRPHGSAVGVGADTCARVGRRRGIPRQRGEALGGGWESAARLLAADITVSWPSRSAGTPSRRSPGRPRRRVPRGRCSLERHQERVRVRRDRRSTTTAGGDAIATISTTMPGARFPRRQVRCGSL
jgi:hypothetical protein